MDKREFLELTAYESCESSSHFIITMPEEIDEMFIGDGLGIVGYVRRSTTGEIISVGYDGRTFYVPADKVRGL